MPKKTKGKRVGKGRVEAGSGSDEDGSTCNDSASVVSLAGSETSTIQEDSVDESSVEEASEGAFKDAIDLATEKSAATRTKALDTMCQILLKRYCPDFIDNRKATVADIVEKSLKRGKGAEVNTAARLALLLGLQLLDAEEVYTELKPTMLHLVADNTQPLSARAAVCSGLAGLCFLGGVEIAEVVQVMKLLETIFSASSPKKDGTVASLSPEQTSLHTAALSAWALLSTLLSQDQIYEMTNRYVVLLQGMFSSVDVDLRITAGETLVLLLETAYDHDEDFEPDNFEELVQTLKQLATDSSKSKSKKDRKEQRSSFRDVLRGVEEAEPPSETVKFGRETLKLDCWFRKIQYDWFCKMMGAGMNYHLGVNSILREIFELGAPLNLLDASAHKLSKSERNAANQQAFKMRTQVRSKNRDKRSAVF